MPTLVSAINLLTSPLHTALEWVSKWLLDYPEHVISAFVRSTNLDEPRVAIRATDMDKLSKDEATRFVGLANARYVWKKASDRHYKSLKKCGQDPEDTAFRKFIQEELRKVGK